MKWRQGLAIITRVEHWDQAAQHLWGLGPRDIAAYLHTPLPETLHPTDDFRKTRTLAQDKFRLPHKPRQRRSRDEEADLSYRIQGTAVRQLCFQRHPEALPFAAAFSSY